MNDRQILTDILMDSLPEDSPWKGKIIKLTDHLIAHGVTVRKHGRWDKNWSGDNIVYCNQCYMPQDVPTPYCPGCGAYMKGDADAEKEN